MRCTQQARAQSSVARGYSLIELLIALLLGLVLTAGMLSVFSGNKRSAELNSAISNLQENARFALDSISRDVRMAGFQGCTPISGGSVNILAADAPITDTALGLRSSAIWGSVVDSATSWQPMPPWGTGANGFNIPTAIPGIPDTHVLAVQFGDADTYRLSQPVGGTGSPDASGMIFLDASTSAPSADIQVGDLAIISDCIDGDLFEVTGVTDAGLETIIEHDAGPNVSGTFTTAYGRGTAQRRQTMVMRFNARVYFVGDTGEVDENGNAVTALYQMDPPFDGSNPPVEIVQGVEAFVVSFEVSDAVGRRRTVAAGDATFNPANVTSVRIGILMASQDPIAEQDDNTTYSLAGVEVPPVTSGNASAGEPAHAGDRRFRLAFNTTIKVRNFRE